MEGKSYIEQGLTSEIHHTAQATTLGITYSNPIKVQNAPSQLPHHRRRRPRLQRHISLPPALFFLARTAICLTNFHTASACSPTRSMLSSGADNHIAGLGQMAEHMRNASIYENRPGYEGYLNFRVAALSEVLQDEGYFTTMAGKSINNLYLKFHQYRHLGLSKTTSPSARGFTNNLSFLPGCGNHFNYESQLSHPGDGILAPMKPAHDFWMRDDAFIDRIADLPSPFYSTTAFTDALLESLRSRNDNQPLFAYLPFTAPHWPLQAPREVIQMHRGMYDDAPGALRRRRLRESVRLGRVDDFFIPKDGNLRRMVDIIDRDIQRVIDQLAGTDELDNTFVLFMSDNGAEGSMLEVLPVMGPSGSLSSIIGKYYDNSLENMVNADSFVWYGPA
ncbi:hypothetical protein N8T08_009217 [Aspergillus melleus]|uniref:Uncharacterized protein n=1 Tax=Aspergillus melleus TaxID=138277 RepID=A0ACC3AUJ6_9EURO|nr:hypothetical protein N8T08_009217 [Aspergillus melleus]